MSTGGKKPSVTREQRIEELKREKQLVEEEMRRNQEELLQLQNELRETLEALSAEQRRQIGYPLTEN
jgi:hypothetical protein